MISKKRKGCFHGFPQFPSPKPSEVGKRQVTSAPFYKSPCRSHHGNTPTATEKEHPCAFRSSLSLATPVFLIHPPHLDSDQVGRYLEERGHLAYRFQLLIYWKEKKPSPQQSAEARGPGDLGMGAPTPPQLVSEFMCFHFCFCFAQCSVLGG